MQDTANYADHIVGVILGKQITIDCAISNETLKTVLAELSERYSKGKKVSKLDLIFHKSWGQVLEKTSINGVSVSTQEECDVLLKYAELQNKRRNLGLLWDEIVAKHGGTYYEEFGYELERVCLKRADKIEKYLNWYDSIFQQMILSLDKQAIFPEKEYSSEAEELREKLFTINERLPLNIEAIQIVNSKIVRIKEVIAKNEATFSSPELKDSAVCLNIATALRAEDTNAFEEWYNVFESLYKKYHYLNERKRILQFLRHNAPDWAAQIENRVGIHGKDKTP